MLHSVLAFSIQWDPGLRGVLVLAALWWPWTAYAWLTNTVDPEEGFVGAAIGAAMLGLRLTGLLR